MRFQGAEMSELGVEVSFDVPEDLPMVLVDVGQLRQALLNIVRNAAEATDEVRRAAADDDFERAARLRDRDTLASLRDLQPWREMFAPKG